MTLFEIVIYPILILCYGVVCYICGKGDFLNVIVLMLQDKAKELKTKTNSDNDALIEGVELAIDFGLPIPEEDFKKYEELVGENNEMDKVY